jgi:predicted ATP-dependent Lon-type protease
MGKPIQQQMVVLGSMSLGGNVVPVENLAESLQVALDSGARRILLPMASVHDIPTVPGEPQFRESFLRSFKRVFTRIQPMPRSKHLVCNDFGFPQ